MGIYKTPLTSSLCSCDNSNVQHHGTMKAVNGTVVSYHDYWQCLTRTPSNSSDGELCNNCDGELCRKF